MQCMRAATFISRMTALRAEGGNLQRSEAVKSSHRRRRGEGLDMCAIHDATASRMI